REVHHFVEHEGVVQYLHGGRLLKEGSRFHDGYGLESLRESVTEEAQELASVYGVTRESSLVVRAVVTRREYSQVVERFEKDRVSGELRPVYACGVTEAVPARCVEVPWASDGRQAEYELARGGAQEVSAASG